MAARVLRPEGKGLIFLDSHPAGCAATVDAMISEAARDQAGAPDSGGLRALVIGCSAGYGLAATVPRPARPEH